MKRIRPSEGPHQWPRWACSTVEARKRDLLVRIADWTRDRDEPAYDVEVYIGGVYDWNESQSFTFFAHKTKARAKELAVQFAQQQIMRLL